MTLMTLSRPLSFNTLKELTPFFVIMCTVVGSWYSQTLQVALEQQKIEQILQNQQRTETIVDAMNTQLGVLTVTQATQGVRVSALESEVAPLLSRVDK